MALAYADFRRALDGHPLPCAVVDLDAFDRNLARHLSTLPAGVPLRVATKSLRVSGLLRRLLDRGEGKLRGLMCYSLREAAALVERGFDDLLVAYPHCSRADLDLYARILSAGANVSLAVDSHEVAAHMSAVAAGHGVRMLAVICVDMSLRPARGLLHLGVRRSPLHSTEQVLALADCIRRLPAMKLHGLLGYEAQVAGLGDESPFDSRVVRAGKRLVRAASMADIKVRRSRIAKRLGDRGFELAFVNGGGTGSLDLSGPDNGVSELTAGSGFFKPLLFDGYASPFVKSLEPAAFFVLEVTRKSSPDRATCLGGGYVASGSAGPEKLPRPHLPAGLRLIDAEGAGEVQTPLEGASALAIGDPVVFRHAKAGELMERFNEVVLVQGGAVAGTMPTYRGEGWSFL